jgi:prolipoprotein diacylglyceryltransferase
VGNLFNSEIVGKIVPEGSRFGVIFPRYDGLPPELCPSRYPTQVLEAALGFLVLTLLIVVDRKANKEERPVGMLASLFLMAYFLGRFLVEFLKERQNIFDTLILSRGQLLSIAPFLLGLILFLYAKKKNLSAKTLTNLKKPQQKRKDALNKEAAGRNNTIASKKRKAKK